LSPEGFDVHVCARGKEALDVLGRRADAYNFVIAKLGMPDVGALDVLDQARAREWSIPIVVTAERASIPKAVEAMRRGAFDLLTTPFSADELRQATTRAYRASAGSGLFAPGLPSNTNIDVYCGIVGAHPRMREVHRLIDAVGPTDTTVLVEGETGTGKELAARAVHARSDRALGAFVAVNCGAITSTLVESELFGHAKGAFSGATSAHRGYFEQAHGGTLFFDEIGELDLTLQTRLLRVLQEREIRPVGATRSMPIDTRIIAATNRDLRSMVASGSFRRDLYYRLRVFSLRLPSLRERLEDLPLLVSHFAMKHAARLGRPVPAATPEGLAILSEAPWPGNVRELENAVERAVILGMRLDENAKRLVRERTEPDVDVFDGQPLTAAKQAFEYRYLVTLLERTGGNRAEAARIAGTDPSNLRRLLKRHALST
jgi:DNA-binding NtrC family response regulator